MPEYMYEIKGLDLIDPLGIHVVEILRNISVITLSLRTALVKCTKIGGPNIATALEFEPVVRQTSLIRTE